MFKGRQFDQSVILLCVRDEWNVLLRDNHLGYMSWQEYEDNRSSSHPRGTGSDSRWPSPCRRRRTSCARSGRTASAR
ncbi:hypothetical protein NKI79_30650 [Mesorhizobium sp. M0340]|uniref:hypothetical protein n=1 Tax=Mesorhizobium sp. M0340 TaxID=2956939 RepID=UPI00333BAEFD